MCAKGVVCAAVVALGLVAVGASVTDNMPDETEFWQAKIDAANAAGGGKVTVPEGIHYVKRGLTLKSNVTLHISKGARLMSSTNAFEYIRSALIYSDGAENVAVEGEGTLDAQGHLWPRRIGKDEKGRDIWRSPDRAHNVLYFKECRNVRVEDVTLTNPSSWTCFFNDCDGVVVRRVKVWSHGNTSNDGIDIASRNVLIEDCDIDSEDDSLVFKTILPHHLVENVVVRNCRLSSNSGICKFGTETLATTRNVRIYDCEMSVRTPIKFRGAHNWFPGQRDKPEETTNVAIDAIELAVVDGGNLEDIEIRNIKMGFGILALIVIRHGDRKPRKNPGKPSLKNILLENIEMTLPARAHVPCQITGVPGFRPENITLRNVKLLMRGGVKMADVNKAIPERRGGYPGPCIFGSNQFLPAWGFYIRHADGIRFENVSLKLEDGARDERPAVYIDDADVTFADCDIAPTPDRPDGEKIVRVNCPGTRRTDLLVFFDTENFTSPMCAEGILLLAQAMSAEGVKANFAVVGKLAEALVAWGRQDIIEAISKHDIQSHTYGHSVHPTLTQIADENDYKTAYRIIREQETKNNDVLQRLIPDVDKLVAFVPPGDNEPYVAQYVYRDLGFTLTCGMSFCPNDAGDQWFCGMYQIPYSVNFEEFLPGRRPCYPKSIADRLAKAKKAVIYCHPHRVFVDEAWDMINFCGKNPTPGEPYAEAKTVWPAEERQRYLDDIRRTVRYLKADKRFRFITASELAEEVRMPRERMMKADAPFLLETLQKEFGPVDRWGWCLADVFRGAVRFLRGEEKYDPSREFGFLEKPVGITEPCTVSAADLRTAAKQMNIRDFLPATIPVGDVTLGPRDFLMAALEVLATGAKTVRIEPVDSQLGSFARLPELEKKHYGSWPVYPKEMKGDHVSEMARLQLWTLRKGL